uniref:hypothetical protein n=1 Tax=Bacteroides acidifaciens TaxID=85831 RepID=UPI0025B13930
TAFRLVWLKMIDFTNSDIIFTSLLWYKMMKVNNDDKIVKNNGALNCVQCSILHHNAIIKIDFY